MSFTHLITRTVFDGAISLSKTESVVAGASANIDEAVPTASTDLLVAFAFTKAKLKSIYMLSDQAMRVCTNDTHSGSPGETINLVAGSPYMWSVADGYFANPFAGNVTALYVTNTSGATAQFQVRTIVDPT